MQHSRRLIQVLPAPVHLTTDLVRSVYQGARSPDEAAFSGLLEGHSSSPARVASSSHSDCELRQGPWTGRSALCADDMSGSPFAFEAPICRTHEIVVGLLLMSASL
jgi:hypothetical protein